VTLPAFGDLRKASGAEPGWIDRLIDAVGRKAFILGEGAERERWEQRLFRARWIFLNLRSAPPSRPSRDDWRAVAEKAGELLAALKPLLPNRIAEIQSGLHPSPFPVGAAKPMTNYSKRLAEEVRLPPEWWGGGGRPLGEHYKALQELQKHAEAVAGKSRLRGRKRADHEAVFVTNLLLEPYDQAFKPRGSNGPSPHTGGPTARFVRAFFQSLAGEWCRSTGVAPVGDQSPALKHFVASCPEVTAETLIERAIGGGERYHPPIEGQIPVFPGRFLRQTPAELDAPPAN